MRSECNLQLLRRRGGVATADCYHNIGISKSRVALKRSRVANYKSPLLAVCPSRKRNVIWVNVEPKVFDVREALQSLRRTAPNIDHFIARSGSNKVSNDPPPQRVPSNDTSKQVVEKWHFQPAQQSSVSFHVKSAKVRLLPARRLLM